MIGKHTKENRFDQEERQMTLREAYEKGVYQLGRAYIEAVDVDARILLEFVTGVKRADYYKDPGRLLSQEEEERYLELIDQRCKRIPVQHITGEQEFMGLTFKVNSDVLVPRQETEYMEVLVEGVLAKFARRAKKKVEDMRVLDMCTGSGCILLSLLKRTKIGSGLGVDISDKALDVAKENAHRLGIDTQFCQSDLFTEVDSTYDIIVSNPPYIKTEDFAFLDEEVLLDPRIALDGKEDGLFFLKKIIEEAPEYLEPGGYLFLEIGYDQGDEVQRLMEERGFAWVTLQRDLSGLDRVVSGVYNKQ